MNDLNWTIGYRKRTGNRIHRVTNWHGTWDEAVQMAREFLATSDYPGIQVYYLTTRDAELSGYVHTEDVGNFLTDSGKRIPITDNGTLPPALLLLLPACGFAR